jgi:hypothetical protein
MATAAAPPPPSASCSSSSSQRRSLLLAAATATLLLVLFSPRSAAAQMLPSSSSSGCPVSLTFYPPGTRNLPTAWSRANQTAAGNTREDALLPIALYGIPTPKLHASPLSPVLGEPGTAIPAGCFMGGGAGSITRKMRRRRERRRALLQAAGVPSNTLASPARYAWTWALDGKTPPRQGTPGPSETAPFIELPEIWDLDDGPHTLTLTFVIAARSGSLADGTAVPAADLSITRTVAFYKLTNRPTAKVSVDTCTPSFTLRMKDMWPDAIPAIDVDGNLVPGPDGQTPLAFLRPVYHIWGRFQAGMDGKPFEGEDNDGSREWHFFDRYYLREVGAPRTLDVERPDLAQGYYELSVEGSLTSDFPSLVALAGEDKYGQEGTVYTSIGPGGIAGPTDLAGLGKWNGAFVAGLNATRVGVQKAKSALLALSGPDAPPAVGDRLDFSWVFQGLGNATCAIDGVPRGNAADPALAAALPGACTSPYTVVISDTRNHTLSVTFRDVCGKARTERVEYGAGRVWSTDAILDGLAAADSALALQDPMMMSRGPQGGMMLLPGQERAMGRGGARNGAGGGSKVVSVVSAAVVSAVAAVVVGV